MSTSTEQKSEACSAPRATGVAAIEFAPLHERGFALCRHVLTTTEADQLIQATDSQSNQWLSRGASPYAARNLLGEVPEVARLANLGALVEMARSVLGGRCFPVRCILFDKVSGANWHVGWHQDTMIPVAERVDAPGYGPWSVKAGVLHVKPPAGVLANMLTLRLHLDDCGPENGPLRVLPGSHRHGFLSSDEVKEWIATGREELCTARRGDVLAMRPLLLHASSRAASPNHRRVLHVEYAAEMLPDGLRWAIA
jgi:hypothetical protein